jgi:MFS family permease
MLTVRGIDRRPLSIPAFRRLWLASLVSAIGGSFSVIMVPAQLFALTGSSATVGWSAAVSFPLLAFAALWSGSLADVVDRRRLLLVAHTGLAATYTLLWMQSVMDLQSVTGLLILVGGQGLTYGAIMTTTGAVLPRVVPPDQLAAASSLSSLVRYTGAVLGPLLAGVLIPLVGAGTLYLFDAIALIAVLWAVFRLPPLPDLNQPDSRPATVPHLVAGFRLLAADRILPGVLAVDLAAMAFGMPAALFPELATHWGAANPLGTSSSSDARALGLLYAAYPAGVFAISLISGTFTRTRRPGTLMIAAALVWGVTVILTGLAPNLWLTLAALGFGGAANFVLSTCRNAITQAQPDDARRGRTQGTLTVVLIGGPQAATLLHGLAGSVLGTRWAICVGGLLTVTTVATIAAFHPQLRTYDAPAADADPERPPRSGRTGGLRTH